MKLIEFIIHVSAAEMCDAAENGDLETLKRLLEAGHDVNQRDGVWKRTPLMWAAVKGHTVCVGYLLQNGARLNLEDRERRTALHLAADGGYLEVIKRLVEVGHDVNQRDEEERTPLILAAMKGHTVCVEYLIQNCAQLDLKDKDGLTALHRAAVRGHLEVMKRLVGAGQDVNQRDRGTERTPLMCAAVWGHTDCVEYLIQKGAQLDLEEKNNQTALHYAAMGGRLEVMKRLVDAGQDVNQRDELGERTPLMLAAWQGRTDCVEYLIQKGAQLDLEEKNNQTALHYAAMGGRLEVMKRLVEAGHNVNQRGWPWERTPLMCAAERGHTDCMEYLILNGAQHQLDLRDKFVMLPKLLRHGPKGRLFKNKSLYVQSVSKETHI